jgi:hypothetical protein
LGKRGKCTPSFPINISFIPSITVDNSELSIKLGRPALWISRMRKRFGLPVLEQYPKCYETFLRKVRDLRNLGVSEERLGALWDLERKIIAILHLDLGGGELSLIEGCSVEADPDHRLLLSNADLGVPLMALDLQTGLDFQARLPELFEGKAMGEDALRLLREYRKLLKTLQETICRERKVLTEGLRWQKSVGLDRVR